MVYPVAETTNFMLEVCAIREYKRIVQGGSAAATEVLCYGTSVVVERLEEKGQGFRSRDPVPEGNRWPVAAQSTLPPLPMPVAMHTLRRFSTLDPCSSISAPSPCSAPAV
jgi:hypothetical protein